MIKWTYLSDKDFSISSKEIKTWDFFHPIFSILLKNKIDEVCVIN